MEMATEIKRWTLEELHSLPDDGNKYELIRGELFVTPPPTVDHETIAARLTEILQPYVLEYGLGHVYRPRAVFRFEGSEVEPDLMVRQELAGLGSDWARAPNPILIVEILSDSTRRRDHGAKREFYVDGGIAEYWIVDGARRTVTVVRPGYDDAVAHDRLTWAPREVSEPLTFELEHVFGRAIESGSSA